MATIALFRTFVRNLPNRFGVADYCPSSVITACGMSCFKFFKDPHHVIKAVSFPAQNNFTKTLAESR
jgi:hypothetical protein